MAMRKELEHMVMGAVPSGGYRATIYCRFSKDDELQTESASIANQRKMLLNYCDSQKWEVIYIFQDDGYTGLNMEHPDFKRLLEAAENRRVNPVITKDLSRLVRNHLETGNLIEIFFLRQRPCRI